MRRWTLLCSVFSALPVAVACGSSSDNTGAGSGGADSGLTGLGAAAQSGGSGGASALASGGVTAFGGSGMSAGGASSSEAGSGGAATESGGASQDAATGGSASGGSASGGSSNASGGSSNASGGSSNAAGGSASGGSASGGSHTLVPYILGADISFVQEQEDGGRNYSDNGVPKDILQLLKDHGFNYIRLRLFNDPGAPGGYQHEFTERAEAYCDTAHTIEMAQRVKSAGMGFSLDFHYSDTWADPDDQHKPAAWENLGFDALVTAVHDFTVDTLLEFQAAGALPDMVQVGNEITPGMLLPEGSSSNWANLSRLLNAGIEAVNEVDPGIIKVMHIESPHHPDTVSWWAQSAVDSGVDFDILGISCYSAWHEGPDTWRSTFERVASEHPDLQFMIAEYADNYREANDVMFNLPQGAGTMFWEPTVDGEWGTGLIDWQGNTRDTMSLYDQMASDYGLR